VQRLYKIPAVQCNSTLGFPITFNYTYLPDYFNSINTFTAEQKGTVFSVH